MDSILGAAACLSLPHLGRYVFAPVPHGQGFT
jgi:hypothetical protein